MAQDITIAGATFNGVPSIMVPTAGGGQAVFADPSDTTATAADVAQGKVFLDSDGEYQTGTASGGVPVSVPSKDVDFYDYDGTRVYSYTAAEFANLTALPANPDHSHDAVPLTAQGWNWSLTDAKAYVASYGILDVGQLYVPADGKTHIRIHIDASLPASRRTATLRWTQSVSNGVTVDWGDGSTPQTYSDTTTANHDHLYAVGDYDATLEVTSGTATIEGDSSNSIFGDTTTTNGYKRVMIIGVNIGPDVGICSYAFEQCRALEYITMTSTTACSGERLFENTMVLQCVVFSTSTSSIGNNAFNSAAGMRYVVMPRSVSTLGAGAFNACGLIKRVTPYGDFTQLQYNTFRNILFLRDVVIKDDVTFIGSNNFENDYCLMRLVVPASVGSISASAFANCTGMAEYHFQRTTPPTLSNTNAFTGIPDDCIIYVPRGSLNAYKTASNWSTYANHMQEEPA